MTDVPGPRVPPERAKTAHVWTTRGDPPVPVRRRVLHAFATALILGGVLWIAAHLR